VLTGAGAELGGAAASQAEPASGKLNWAPASLAIEWLLGGALPHASVSANAK
jgi:hypothetical protein